MTEQRWKTDPALYAAPTKQDGQQVKKVLDYDTTYRKEFLDADPLQDWDSIERCKWLWEWGLEMLEHGGIEHDATKWSVLDVGTKDAQFPEWLRENNIMGIGLEYSEPYVRYAINKGRPSAYGNACDMEYPDNTFDFVFSHHLHGLLPDYWVGLTEMFRVTDKYMLALNQVPGNTRKHFSYIDSPQIYHDFIESVDCEILYNDYLDTGFGNEWVIFLRKLQPADYVEQEKEIDLEPQEETLYAIMTEEENLGIDPDEPMEGEFRKKKENPFF